MSNIALLFVQRHVNNKVMPLVHVVLNWVSLGVVVSPVKVTPSPDVVELALGQPYISAS